MPLGGVIGAAGNHWPAKPRMKFFDQSATIRKCGISTDCCHQGSRCTGARAEQADQQHDQQYAARTAEDHAEEAVGAGEAGDPDQFADEVVDQRPGAAGSR